MRKAKLNEKEYVTDDEKAQYYSDVKKFLSNPVRIYECPRCKRKFVDKEDGKLRNFSPSEMSKEYDFITRFFTGGYKRAIVRNLAVSPFCLYRLWSRPSGKFGVTNYFYLYQCSSCKSEFFGPNWYVVEYNSRICNIVFLVLAAIVGSLMTYFFSVPVGIITALATFFLLWIVFLIFWKKYMVKKTEWANNKNIAEFNHVKTLERIAEEERDSIVTLESDVRNDF